MDIKIENNFVKIDRVRFELDERLKFLLNKTSKEHLVRCVLRYAGYGITGQHCALPINVYKYLYSCVAFKNFYSSIE